MVKTLPPERQCDVSFQGKDTTEEFQFCFHQHAIRMLWPVTKTLCMTGLIVTAGYTAFFSVGVNDASTRRLMLAVLLALFFLTQMEFITRFYRYCLYVIVVTDRKVHRIKKTLLTIDDHESVDLWALQDINRCQHGVVQNIFGYGSLIMEAQETILRVHFVPKIAEKYRELLRLRERARGMLTQIAGTSARSEFERRRRFTIIAPEDRQPERKAVYWQHADSLG